MGKKEVNTFFESYVRGFILADIEREMAFARSGLSISLNDSEYTGGGNYLCALGLLCYTEFMGGLKEGSFVPDSRKLFDSFLHSMGPGYIEFDDRLSHRLSIRDPKRQLSVYEVFRCGMAHEYFIKQSGVIYMFASNVHKGVTIDGEVFTLTPPAPSMMIGPADQGLGELEDGRYFFVVETYFRDFKVACDRLHEEFLSQPSPSIPSFG